MTKKNLTPEDRDLFRRTIGKVLAVKSDKVLLTEGQKPKPIPKPSTISIEGQMNSVAEFNVEQVGVDDLLSYTAPGLQHNVLRKLRKGQFGVDAKIDLHGLNSVEAKRQLLVFLHESIEGGCRCIQIVHGKGHRSTDNHPVIKNNLNVWLRQHKSVLAFCSALPKDGGAGAVLALLQSAEKYSV